MEKPTEAFPAGATIDFALKNQDVLRRLFPAVPVPEPPGDWLPGLDEAGGKEYVAYTIPNCKVRLVGEEPGEGEAAPPPGVSTGEGVEPTVPEEREIHRWEDEGGKAPTESR